MPRLRRLRWVAILLLGAFAAWAQNPAPVITVDHPPNSAGHQAAPYVVMVSLDGFRYDYARKFAARHLLALGAQGATAPQGMIPAYPSLTFPNHYTLVTGLYPEHHGIVANSFYDPARQQRYAFDDPATAGDGSWYGGTPLWVLAERQGMRSACFFWPGSEAEIQGERPTYYLHYDDHYPERRRIDQVIAWLRLPPEQRPHFITLYYANVDHAGHQYGPDSPQTAAAVAQVDQWIGDLWTQLGKLSLPVDLLVVSDHGMEREQGPWIDLDQFTNLANVTTIGSLLYPDSEAAAARLYQELKIRSDAFTVYRRKRVPAPFHYDSNAREGDPIIVANGPYAIRAHAPAAGTADQPPNLGMHGFDPRVLPSMRALFLAVGPDIHPKSTLQPFENVNVYPLVAHLLGLHPPKVDGSLNVLAKILNDQPADEQPQQ